jgi:dephospho-CoA kinase
VVLLALSGKSASGKDAVARGVQDMFPALDWAGLSFGEAIKDEGRRLVAALRSGRDRADAIERIVADLGVRREDAGPLVDLMWTAVRRQELTDRLRHPLVRPALQRWGQLRVREDAGYWTDRALRRLTVLRDAGHSVVLTDMRMPWEADWARAQGFLLVRLDVSDEIRRERTASRDGAMLAPEVERDSTETAMDDYDGFDLRLDNSGDVASVLTAIASAVEERWPRSSRSATCHP